MKYTSFISHLVLFLTSIFLNVESVSGQITIDGKLSPAQELTGTSIDIGQNLGTVSGKNVFHSFGEFNIREEQTVTFTGDASLENVISRVTGGNMSHINGTLASDIPNMYFINPAGVMFGPNAVLDIPGSFHVSSADVLRFDDDKSFFSQPLESDILSTEAPIAYGFLDAEIGSITFKGTKLSVKPGNNLSVIGEGITLDNATLQAPGGNMLLVSVGSEGEILEGSDIKTSFSEMGDISLMNSSRIDTVEDGGNINIYSQNITMESYSEISTSTFFGSAGNITLDIEETLTIKEGSIISADILFGVAGDIDIRAKNLTMEDQSVISSSSLPFVMGQFVIAGDGEGGNISIKIDETISMTGPQDIDLNKLTLIRSVSVSRIGGNIDIEAHDLKMDNGSQINALSTNISAIDPMKKSSIIILLEGDLIAKNSSQITTQTIGSADGGIIDITAKNISLENFSGISSFSFDTDIMDENFSNNPDLIDITGNGGNINIHAEDIFMKSQSAIASITSTRGDAGNITIDSNRIVMESDSKISNQSFFENKEAGDAGNIDISLKKSLTMKGADISASSESSGGGQIILQVPGRIFIEESEITSQVFTGSDNAGNISINEKVNTSKLEDSVLILKNGDIIARAKEGDGGNIDINTRILIQSSESTIDASSKEGISGIISIAAPDTDLTSGLVTLANNFFHTDSWSLVNCSGNYNEDEAGRLTYQVKEGVSLTPDDLLPTFLPIH